MPRPVFAIVCSLSIVLSASTARAGANTGAAVGLTWDANALRSSPPLATPQGFPLYLTVQNAHDVRQLAVHLSWTPYRAGADCFRVRPLGRAVACSTYTAPPAGTTFAESSYTWTALFATPPVSPFCLVYWVTGSDCDSTAFPQFVVADARARDSAGGTDALGYSGCTVLNGGAEAGGAALRSGPPGDGEGQLPTRLALFARPNPAVGGALIRFELPRPVPCELSILDVAGALVRRAEVEVHSQRGSFRWDLSRGDGRRARPGVYFARLVTPAGTRVVPLTVLR
jgi:hypothetical protein